jgi:hypothetical protein
MLFSVARLEDVFDRSLDADAGFESDHDVAVIHSGSGPLLTP